MATTSAAALSVRLKTVRDGHNPNPASLLGWGSAQNKVTTQSIAASEANLKAKGVELTQWGPDPRSGKVEIRLTHYSQAAAHVLYSLYGNSVVVSKTSMPRPIPADRINDTPPYFGGDFILIPASSSQCTGGPIVHIGSYNYMLTAGHCEPQLNKYVYRSDRSGQTGGPHMGNVFEVRLCNNCIDSELIDHNSANSNYSWNVWSGGDKSQASYAEDGTAFPQPFDLVTQDSAFTGEVNDISVQSVNQYVAFSDGITRAWVTSTGYDDTPVVSEGDSGGPWIVRDSNGAKIAGTTIGGGDCNSQGDNCHVGYYEQIGNIDSFFGTSVG